jgi:two-component system, NtrC family, response regulator AtoC
MRELQSVLKQALLRAHGPVLLAEFLPELVEIRGQESGVRSQESGLRSQESGIKPSLTPDSSPPTPDPHAFIIPNRLGPDSRDLYAETHRELDRLLLPRILDYTGGNQHRAAILLGIARQTLRAKVIELGLQAPRSAGVGSETEK